MLQQQFNKGEIWLAELPFTGNSIQGGGIRPVIICVNSMCCQYSPILHCVPTTTRDKRPMPTHVKILTNSGLQKVSTAMCEQILPLPKSAFIKKVGNCDYQTMLEIDHSIAIQFGLGEVRNKVAYA